MPDDYKYTLTSICLRSGQLTLTQSMLNLFPKEGNLVAVDAEKNNEFSLTLQGKRQVAGLSKFIAIHNLEVNDQIHIQPLDSNKFLFTPYKRERVYEESKEEAKARKLLGYLKEQRTPLSEPEIRTLYPKLTNGIDVADLLSQDKMFVFESGRWQTQDVKLEQQALSEVATVTAKPTASDTPAQTYNEAEVLQAPQQEASPETQRKEPNNDASQEIPSITSYVKSQKVTAYSAPHEEQDLEEHTRAKDLLRELGYRVESLASGQLLAHAELGRHAYSAYIQILPQGQQLNWADLLTRRRDTSANYIAVIGDQQGLLRLGAPAGMARATLWSWAGLARVKDLMQVVPISPYDLETHFERDGLFENGKDRFEKTIGDRISERGVFSTVLSRLALMKAPSIFLLDDVVDDQVARGQVLKVLENLSGAPFHMIAKVDSGEFCLRFKVADSLEQISRYALSLKDRLPSRFKEHLTGVEEEAFSLTQQEKVKD